MSNEKVIKEKALSTWSRRGFSAVGIQEICTLAGISKPTLYHYFGSKQGLLASILDSSYSLLCSVLEKDACYQGNISLALSIWASIWIEDAVKNPDFFRLTQTLTLAPPDSDEFLTMAPWNSRIYSSLVNLFKSASKDHGNMQGRSQSYALAFLGLMQTHGNMVLNHHLSWTEELSKKTLHYFMHGIFS